MPKRHKHVKPSAKKSVPKTPKKRGSGHAQKSRNTKDTRKKRVKPISKNTKISSKRTPSKPRRNKHTQKSVKRIGRSATVRKGTKKAGQTQSKVRRKYVERLKRKKELEREIEQRQEELENLGIESLKVEKEFTTRKQPIDAKRWIATREGEKLKEKKIKGYRYVYYFKFPQGTFEKKIAYIRNVDLSFLDHALKRAVVAPRAVSVTLESKTKDDRRRYFYNLSAIDFVVNLNNIKKFILESMIEWQDRWAIGVLDRGETYTIDYEEYNPDFLYSVSIKFIY